MENLHIKTVNETIENKEATEMADLDRLEITENTVNEKEIKTMEQNKINNGATETQETTQETINVDILANGVFIKPEAGKPIEGMTSDAYIEEIKNSLNNKSQVWAFVDESVIAITSDSSNAPTLNTKLKKIWSDATCERVSGDVVIKTLQNKLSAIAKKWAVKEAIYQIEELGGKFENGGCTLATSGDYKLILNMFVDKATGSRYYQIIEETESLKWGNLCTECRFRVKDMKDAKRITGFLEERLGDYSEIEGSITKICTLIEKYRLIAVDEDNIINGEIHDVDYIFSGFENYIRNHITENGIIAVRLRTGEIHVGIGASETRAASKNFDTILDCIAPANSTRAVKSEMKKAGMFKCDRADYQKTLSDVSCNIGDKIYSFNFDKEVLEELYKLFVDKTKTDENTAA